MGSSLLWSIAPLSAATQRKIVSGLQDRFDQAVFELGGHEAWGLHQQLKKKDLTVAFGIVSAQRALQQSHTDAEAERVFYGLLGLFESGDKRVMVLREFLNPTVVDNLLQDPEAWAIRCRAIANMHQAIAGEALERFHARSARDPGEFELLWS